MSENILNQQKQTPRIAVITSDAPVIDGAVARTMCHANAHFLKALDPYVCVIFASNARMNEIEPQLQKKCVLINSLFFFKAVRKLARLIFGRRMNNAGFQWFVLPALVRKLKEVKAEWIFCPCGSNPFDLERAVLLAKSSQLPLSIYLVDDIVEGSRLSGIKDHIEAASKDAPDWIRSIDKLFVISEGFRTRIKDLYGKDSTVLPLAYEFEDGLDLKKDGLKEDQIIFVGNLSHFYADGIKALAQVLDELNQTREKPIVLKLTLQDMVYVKKMIGDFKCIQPSPWLGLDDLTREIAVSLMAFVPYSFDRQYRIMTQTSFPSKVLPCLAAARHVLVYGPEDSSLVRHFQQYGLLEALGKNDIDALREIIIRQVNTKMDHGEQYRQVMREVHDPKKVAAEFLSGLKQTEALFHAK